MTSRTSCPSSSTWTWSVKISASTFPQRPWCCFRSWSVSTSSWCGCSAHWLSCRGWEGDIYQNCTSVVSYICLRHIFNMWWFPLIPQALAGEVGMSSELDEVARALFNGHVPGIWKKLAPDTLKSLGNWMSHFRRRHEQYNSWVRMDKLSEMTLTLSHAGRAGSENILCGPGGGGWTKGHVAVRTPHPRVLPDCTDPSCLQEERLASRLLHTVYTSDPVPQRGGNQRQTWTR